MADKMRVLIMVVPPGSTKPSFSAELTRGDNTPGGLVKFSLPRADKAQKCFTSACYFDPTLVGEPERAAKQDLNKLTKADLIEMIAAQNAPAS